MIRTVSVLLLLTGCAGQACKPTTVTEILPTRVETRTVYVKAPPPPRGSVILDAYRESETQQNQLALKGTIPAIQKLTLLKLAVRNAFVPLQTPGHRPTDAEIKKAMVAYGDLQSYLNEPHAVRK
jgi:hypothetical protein